MGKKRAGAQYPHVTTEAREHDHRWCPVAATIARRALAGKEQWGVRHPLPAVRDEATAVEIKRGLYRARRCRQLKDDGLPALSVQADYDRLPDGTFQPWIRVWTRNLAKAEIIRRVKNGETLHYNVRR